MPLRVLVAEIVREKILRTTGEEIPMLRRSSPKSGKKCGPDLTKIHCAIFVEQQSLDHHQPRWRTFERHGTKARATLNDCWAISVIWNCSSKSKPIGAIRNTYWTN